MDKAKEDLEGCLGGENKKSEESKEGMVCGYCGKELDLENYYQYSPQGGKYCNKECFDMFTED